MAAARETRAGWLRRGERGSDGCDVGNAGRMAAAR